MACKNLKEKQFVNYKFKMMEDQSSMPFLHGTGFKKIYARWHSITLVKEWKIRLPDKLQLIRKVFDMWNNTFQDFSIPGANSIVDEKALTFRGSSCLLQCITPKAWKYGIKLWVFHNSQTSYALKLDIEESKEPSEQRASRMRNIVVINLSNSYKNSSKKITRHEFFPSLRLGRELLRRKLKIHVTKRKNRTELPTVFMFAKRKKLLWHVWL